MDAKIRDMAVAAAQEAGLDPALVLGIVSVESGGQPCAARYEPLYRWTLPQAERPGGCSHDTELVLQRTSWGLMQLMGALARELGFEGWLPELTDEALNLKLGCRHLVNLTRRFGERHGPEGVIAAYNAGSPRKSPAGEWVNQGYVNKVKAAMGKAKETLTAPPVRKGRKDADAS